MCRWYSSMSLKGCLGGAATTQVIYTLPVLSIIAIVADIVCTLWLLHSCASLHKKPSVTARLCWLVTDVNFIKLLVHSSTSSGLCLKFHC